MCLVEVEGIPKLQTACSTPVRDGMVVYTRTDRVQEAQNAVVEFLLVNHPLDCPVCDQAGECWLQIYYMRHGLYEPRMTDEKVHKPKAVPLGPHVILDAERCILCSRCVRFCDEVTGAGELGIFNRGDHSEIGLFPGKTLENKYSGNVIDICPVGALTDRDFRFQVRVWYLDTARSVCNGCARGCNVEVHTSRRRLHHNQGRRIARIKPRHNPDVNQWWICDDGRYGFRWIDDDTRLLAPARRANGKDAQIGWDEAIAALAEALKRYRPEEVGILASPQMSNEDLFALQRIAGQVGLRAVDHRVPPREPGDEDELLIRADKNPNRRGAELIGLGLAEARAILEGARQRRIKLLWVFQHDLLDSGWPRAEVAAALAGAETVVFQGPSANATSAGAHLLLPSAAYVEREGTFTNFQGRVQRFRTVVEPLGEARADWSILGRLGRALGGADPVFAAGRAEQVFAGLAGQVAAFSGMSYRGLGDAGLMVKA
jgi:NADH-quinone oxidoreductase subunit G